MYMHDTNNNYMYTCVYKDQERTHVKITKLTLVNNKQGYNNLVAGQLTVVYCLWAHGNRQLLRAIATFTEM